MPFFNFGNHETYHFFQWLVHSGQIDFEAMVDQVLKKVERSDLFEMDLATAYLAKEELEKLLRQSFDGLKRAWFTKHQLDLDRYSVDRCAASKDYTELDALFVAMLERAAGQISFPAVAEALLRQAGKWLPEED